MGGMVVALFWLLATGRLSTRNVLDEWRAESRTKDEQLAEKDRQLAEKDRQLAHLAEVGRTVDAIMRSLKAGPPAGGA